jgi:hypothetical protein
MNPTLKGLTPNALREQLDWAEAQAGLAEYCESWERAEREQKYWLTIAQQIRAEIERRKENRGGTWPPAQ